MRKIVFAAAVLLIAAGLPGAVYVQSLKASVMSGPSFKSDRAFEAQRGEELAVREKSGMWYKVSLGERTGWVPALVVGPRPPMGKVSVFTGEEEDISASSRRRASAVTSAAAARGLTEDDRRRLGHRGVADFYALGKIESVTVTDAELSGFMEPGQ
jgi:hypothetical protein